MAARVELDVDDLVRRYEAGTSNNELAKIFGVSRQVIYRCLRERAVRIRGITETMASVLSKRYATMSKEDRKRFTAAANEAARGRKHSIEERIKRAASNERTKANRSTLEVWLGDELTAAGIDFVSTKAVGMYNIDVALTESRVAVEVFGGNWHNSPKHSARFRERTDYLIDSGWLPVIIWSVKDKPLGVGARDYVISLHQRRCKGEPFDGKEHVIWGTGEAIPAGQYDPNTGATVKRLEGTDRPRDLYGRFSS